MFAVVSFTLLALITSTRALGPSGSPTVHSVLTPVLDGRNFLLWIPARIRRSKRGPYAAALAPRVARCCGYVTLSSSRHRQPNRIRRRRKNFPRVRISHWLTDRQHAVHEMKNGGAGGTLQLRALCPSLVVVDYVYGCPAGLLSV